MNKKYCPNCGSASDYRERCQGYCFDCWNYGLPELRARIAELEQMVREYYIECQCLEIDMCKLCTQAHALLQPEAGKEVGR